MHTAQLNLTYCLEPLPTRMPGFDKLEVTWCGRILVDLEKYAFWFGSD